MHHSVKNNSAEVVHLGNIIKVNTLTEVICQKRSPMATLFVDFSLRAWGRHANIHRSSNSEIGIFQYSMNE